MLQFYIIGSYFIQHVNWTFVLIWECVGHSMQHRDHLVGMLDDHGSCWGGVCGTPRKQGVQVRCCQTRISSSEPPKLSMVSRTLETGVVLAGGHSPIPGDSNIDTGVLISLKHLHHVSYDAETGHVSMGPGARWNDVYDELDKYNRTMVGGRVMDVGVGGLMLGCGLSYLSDLYGLACDNVVSYEVVLADGRIVEASATSHQDLFWGLGGVGPVTLVCFPRIGGKLI